MFPRYRELILGYNGQLFIGSRIHLLEVDSSGPPLCKRWMHYFESITSIIFCTALSDYDRMIATHHVCLAQISYLIIVSRNVCTT